VCVYLANALVNIHTTSFITRNDMFRVYYSCGNSVSRPKFVPIDYVNIYNQIVPGLESNPSAGSYRNEFRKRSSGMFCFAAQRIRRPLIKYDDSAQRFDPLNDACVLKNVSSRNAVRPRGVGQRGRLSSGPLCRSQHVDRTKTTTAVRTDGVKLSRVPAADARPVFVLFPFGFRRTFPSRSLPSASVTALCACHARAYAAATRFPPPNLYLRVVSYDTARDRMSVATRPISVSSSAGSAVQFATPGEAQVQIVLSATSPGFHRRAHATGRVRRWRITGRLRRRIQLRRTLNHVNADGSGPAA